MTWVRNGCYYVRNDQKVGTKWPNWYEMTWVRNDRLPTGPPGPAFVVSNVIPSYSHAGTVPLSLRRIPVWTTISFYLALFLSSIYNLDHYHSYHRDLYQESQSVLYCFLTHSHIDLFHLNMSNRNNFMNISELLKLSHKINFRLF